MYTFWTKNMRHYRNVIGTSISPNRIVELLCFPGTSKDLLCAKLFGLENAHRNATDMQ